MLQPQELNVVLALLLAEHGNNRPGHGFGGLTDVQLGVRVWGSPGDDRKAQRLITNINSQTDIKIVKDGSRLRYLRWDPDELDYHVFLELMSRARSVVGRERLELAGRALELVRGVPLTSPTVPTSWLDLIRAISSEICDAAVLWLRCAIELNETGVLERACQLHHWFPGDEKLCQHLMALLYRAGRRAKALECGTATLAVHKPNGSRLIEQMKGLIETDADPILVTETLQLSIGSTQQPFQVRFSFAEIGDFFDRMCGDDAPADSRKGGTIPIADWRPELIVGINRGGSIVGGMLSKRLGLTRVVPLLVLWRTDEHQHREFYIANSPLRDTDYPGDDPSRVQRILLTDDVYRTGTHVRFARDALKDAFPLADVRVATLIWYREDHFGSGPGRGDVAGPMYFGRLVQSRNFELPWDPPHRG